MPPVLLAPTPIEDATRREFITGVGAAALAAAFLAACGDDDEAPEEISPSTKSVTTKYGTYDIPVVPQRLVVMDNRYTLETAIALGISPVGIGQRFSFVGGAGEYVAPWVPYVEPEAEVAVFDGREPDLEFLLTLQPDLILCAESHLDGEGALSFASLSQIAPVLPVAISETRWRDSLRQVAEWLDREEQHETAVREYERLRDEIKARHDDRIAANQIVFGSFEAPSTMWLVDFQYVEGPAVQALADLGGQLLETSIPEDPSFPGWRQFSMENVQVIEQADAVLIWAPDAEQRDQLLADPLWPRLPAVQAGRAVISTNNVGEGSVYTVMECLRLWDQVYSTLA